MPTCMAEFLNLTFKADCVKYAEEVKQQRDQAAADAAEEQKQAEDKQKETTKNANAAEDSLNEAYVAEVKVPGQPSVKEQILALEEEEILLKQKLERNKDDGELLKQIGMVKKKLRIANQTLEA